MIKAILIFNNQGKPRMTKFYQRYSETEQQSMIEVSFEPKRVSGNVYGFCSYNINYDFRKYFHWYLDEKMVFVVFSKVASWWVIFMTNQ